MKKMLFKSRNAQDVKNLMAIFFVLGLLVIALAAIIFVLRRSKLF